MVYGWSSLYPTLMNQIKALVKLPPSTQRLLINNCKDMIPTMLIFRFIQIHYLTINMSLYKSHDMKDMSRAVLLYLSADVTLATAIGFWMSQTLITPFNTKTFSSSHWMFRSTLLSMHLYTTNYRLFDSLYSLILNSRTIFNQLEMFRCLLRYFFVDSWERVVPKLCRNAIPRGMIVKMMQHMIMFERV